MKIKTIKLTFEFYGSKAEEARDVFTGWYLDGGGDSGFCETCENECIDIDDQDWEFKKEPHTVRIFAKELE